MIEDLCEITEVKLNQHIFKVLNLKDEYFLHFKELIIAKLPEYYLSTTSFQRTMILLGKEAAYKKLKLKFPQVLKLRSGDLGEVISSSYIEHHLDYLVPINKIQWRDHRDMAMRGDDVIALKIEGDNFKFIKCESKSAQKLSTSTLDEARKELDSFDGRPSPHSIEFIIERLYESGKQSLAEKLEIFNYTKTIKKSDVKHLLFVITKSNPDSLQRKAFESYIGDFCQISIGMKVDKHPELVNEVFSGLEKKYE